MKVYRGPRSGGFWSLTDSKKPQKLAQAWAPGRKIVLDGTIEKDGERHTDFGLEIEEDDVVALFNALIKRHREERSQLIRDLQESEKKYETAIEGLLEIYNLNAYLDKAPSKEAFIQAVHEIAMYYFFHKGVKPKIKWFR